jgi:voltage-gated potassium channel
VLVNFVGAAGMLSFENPTAIRAAGFPNGAQPGDGLHGYADALWFVAMLLTSIGSIYWPYTALGRVLCWFLSLYGLSVFGYITAAVAGHFVGMNQAKQSEQSTSSSSDATSTIGEHSP